MVDLSEFDDETIQKALWLQQKIKRDGLDAVRFIAAARTHLQREAPGIVSKHLNRTLKRI